VRTDRIGDVLLSMPVAAAIRAAVPGAHIALLARSATAVIGERNPAVDAVVTVDDERGRRRSFFEMARLIKRGSYDCAVVLHPDFRTAFMLAYAGIPVRVGTAYRFYSFLFNYRHREHRKISLKHEAEYNLGLLAPLEIPYDQPQFQFEIYPDDLRQADEALFSCGIKKGGGFCVIHPGSGNSAMDWPAESYAAAAALIGSDLRIRSVITWGPGERELAETVAGRAGGAADALPESLPLPAVAALLGRALFVLAPSTGILHLAHIAGTPVIGLYPPVRHASPRRWGPYGSPENTLVPPVENDREYKRMKSLDAACMKRITPEMVLQKARSILRKK